VNGDGNNVELSNNCVFLEYANVLKLILNIKFLFYIMLTYSTPVVTLE
jgi:hypothetical protein